MTVTVVIASFRQTELLAACLASVVPQARRLAGSVVVARPPRDTAAAAVQARFPDVRFVAAAGDDIPRLRGAGLAVASSDLVAVTEDHCVADGRWLAALVQAQANTRADVVGGGMGNARHQRAVDWAAYFAEYGFFSWARPRESEGVPLLTGANVAYTRAVLTDVTAWTLAGTWENVCHQRLHAQGRRLVFTSEARVLQNHTYQFGAFCRDRYEHGRDYARTRLAEGDGSGRWRLLASTPLLTPLLTARVARAAGGVAPGAFARALPVTVAFLGAWAVGEAVGYAMGAARRP